MWILSLLLSLMADPVQPNIGGKQLIVATNGYAGVVNVRTQLNVGYPNQAGVIEISATNNLYGVAITTTETTNLLFTVNGPFGTNLIQLNFNGGLVFGSNTFNAQGTSKFYILQSYRDVGLGDPGQTLVEFDHINSGTGDA